MGQHVGCPLVLSSEEVFLWFFFGVDFPDEVDHGGDEEADVGGVGGVAYFVAKEDGKFDAFVVDVVGLLFKCPVINAGPDGVKVEVGREVVLAHYVAIYAQSKCPDEFVVEDCCMRIQDGLLKIGK